ncbi:MAG: MoxR family ATPase [Pseudomonadota bacterium]
MSDPVAAIEQAGAELEKVKSEIAKRIVGQRTVVDQSLTAILSGGHALLVGVPGLAKTRLVDTLGKVLGLDSSRIQFTPDLMPADILGSEVLEEGADGARVFKFIQGPVFTRLLMADEINRASPRTQSALLQAMQEYHVTVAGEDRQLDRPFHVLATQNPIEQEGTYPLPEAQLDRFLLQIDVDYPTRDEERDILIATTGSQDAVCEQILSPEKLIEMQTLVRTMPVGEAVVEAILSLVRSARPGEPEAADAATKRLAWGPGPRAAQSLMLAVRAKALLEGRLAPTLDDVRTLAPSAMAHRMALSFSARAEGVSISGVISELLAQTSIAEAA